MQAFVLQQLDCVRLKKTFRVSNSWRVYFLTKFYLTGQVIDICFCYGQYLVFFFFFFKELFSRLSETFWKLPQCHGWEKWQLKHKIQALNVNKFFIVSSATWIVGKEGNMMCSVINEIACWESLGNKSDSWVCMHKEKTYLRACTNSYFIIVWNLFWFR